MKVIPSEKEVLIAGTWIQNIDGSVEADEGCERIRYLTESGFQLISVNENGWSALYKNPNDGSFWELTYPQSELHGGGPPSLAKVSDNYADANYGAKR